MTRRMATLMTLALVAPAPAQAQVNSVGDLFKLASKVMMGGGFSKAPTTPSAVPPTALMDQAEAQKRSPTVGNGKPTAQCRGGKTSSGGC